MNGWMDRGHVMISSGVEGLDVLLSMSDHDALILASFWSFSSCFCKPLRAAIGIAGLLLGCCCFFFLVCS